MNLTKEKFQHILKLQKAVERKDDGCKVKLYEYWGSLTQMEQQELVAMKWMGELDEDPKSFPAMVEEARIHTNISELHKSQLAEYWGSAWSKLNP